MNIAGLARAATLEKMRIFGYDTPSRQSLFPVKGYELMFNPESYSFGYTNTYASVQAAGASAHRSHYAKTQPRKLSFKFILDDSSATAGFVAGSSLLRTTVHQRVEEFLDLTTRVQSDLNAPRYLRLEWGEFQFDCRASLVKVNYTLFNRSGVAMRAELDVSFIEDVETPSTSDSSSILLNLRLAIAGFPLPLMTTIAYQSTIHADNVVNYCLHVARANRLHSLRRLKPGKQLKFPPIENRR